MHADSVSTLLSLSLLLYPSKRVQWYNVTPMKESCRAMICYSSKLSVQPALSPGSVSMLRDTSSPPPSWCGGESHMWSGPVVRFTPSNTPGASPPLWVTHSWEGVSGRGMVGGVKHLLQSNLTSASP